MQEENWWGRGGVTLKRGRRGCGNEYPLTLSGLFFFLWKGGRGHVWGGGAVGQCVWVSVSFAFAFAVTVSFSVSVPVFTTSFTTSLCVCCDWLRSVFGPVLGVCEGLSLVVKLVVKPVVKHATCHRSVSDYHQLNLRQQTETDGNRDGVCQRERELSQSLALSLSPSVCVCVRASALLSLQ